MSGPLALPKITVQKGRSNRLRRGHPWLFSNEVEMTPEAKALPAGSLVQVIDAGGERLGTATFNPHSLIAARIVCPDASVSIDTGFFATRFREALAWRERLFTAPHYRLIHAEADGLPGLVIDRYGDALSVQTNTAGMEALLPLIVEALNEILQPTLIVLANQSPIRGLEGLQPAHAVIQGTVSGPIEIVENGVRFLADLADGQKTGWFFDQRPNRAFVASLAAGRTVADLYSYAGGFGITALVAGQAAHAFLLDRSADALATATQAAALNGVADKVETETGEAFAVMERLAREGRRFGVVIADPPAFVKTKRDLTTGAKGYRKVARLASALVEPGGVLLCASCSHHMPADAFQEEVAHGIGQSSRRGRILWSHGAGPDHPVHPQLPESAYLKALVLQLD